MLRKVNGYYATVQVIHATKRTKDGLIIEFRFRYVINPDRSVDFSERVNTDSVQIEGFRSIQIDTVKSIGRSNGYDWAEWIG